MNQIFTLLRNSILFAILFVSTVVSGQGEWIALGPDDFNQPLSSNASDTSVAINPITGEAYMAFNNPNAGYNEGEGFVRKFNSTTALWEDVGETFSDGTTHNISMEFDSDGVLYVGFQDSVNGSKATVKKFNAATNLWETVGVEGFSEGSVQGTTLAIGSDNTVYLGYRDSSQDHKATVKKFDGTAWVTVGTAGFTANAALYTSLAVADDDTLYMGFASWYSGQMKASVMKFDGTSWQLLGPAAFSDGGTSGVKVAVNPIDNVPYVAYHDYDANVRKFNGTDWESVGAPDFSVSLINKMCFSISSDGTPFIGFSDNAPNRATVMSFNGTAWEIVGTAGFSVEAVFFTDIALAGNTPYMSFVDELNGSKPTLMKFDGIAWQCLGSTMGFSEEATFTSSWSVKSSDLIITDDGSLYMGYIEESNEGSLTVKKFNADVDEWENVGLPGFSTEADYCVSMASYQNLPYIAYVEWVGFPNKATVMKYNGAAWEIVGEAGFTEGSAHQHDIAINPEGIPFIVFKDGANEERATVMKFNGTSWEMVGAAGFSGGIVFDPTIMITADGTPYVAYSESDGFESASVVMMFNGTDWEMVGDEFSDGSAGSINLAMGPDGFLYIAYTEGNAVVKRFNGDEWETVGENGLPGGFNYNIKLAIKPDGQLFVSFQNNVDSDGDKVTVMRYNGIDWVPVGNPGFSAWSAYNPDIVITPDGQYAIVAYSSPCTYAKAFDITCYTTAPVAENQAFCHNATVSELNAEGENIRWYTVAEFGTPLAPDALLTSGTYYVAQMQNDCEGPRLAVNVTINILAEPSAESQSLCAGATVSDLEAAGENLKWYAGENDEEALAPEVMLATGIYYVSQSQNGCEGPKAAVDVTVHTTVEPAAEPQSLCVGAAVSDLEAVGENLKWYATGTDEEALASNTLLAAGTYYVSQTQNGCEGPRLAVDVALNATGLPIAIAQSLCNGATVSDLEGDGENLQWYAAESDEEALASNTSLTGGTYYVSQTINGCEGPKLAVDVIINITDLPDAESVQVITVDDAANPTIEDLTVSGVGLKWYDADGNLLSENTPLETGTTYYVTQTIDGCESGQLGITVELLLGLPQFTDADFSYYPNPVADHLHIASVNNIDRVEVYTLYGQKVSSSIWSTTEVNLDMTGLANSTYLIYIYGDDGVKSFTIIKTF